MEKEWYFNITDQKEKRGTIAFLWFLSRTSSNQICAISSFLFLGRRMISVVLLSGKSEKLMYRFIFFNTFHTNFFFAARAMYAMSPTRVDVNEWLRTEGEKRGSNIALTLIGGASRSHFFRLIPIRARVVRNARYQVACILQLKIYWRTDTERQNVPSNL